MVNQVVSLYRLTYAGVTNTIEIRKGEAQTTGGAKDRLVIICLVHPISRLSMANQVVSLYRLTYIGVTNTLMFFCSAPTTPPPSVSTLHLQPTLPGPP